MPLYIYPPAPIALMSPGLEHTISGVSGLAGAAYFSSVLLPAPVTVTRMRCHVTSAIPTGNIDMGIYDATGPKAAPNNLLGSTGAIASATGIFTQNLTANLSLAAGRYWIAILDTVTDQLFGRSGSLGALPIARTTSTAHTFLPATAGATQANGNTFLVCGLVSGGWA